MTLGSYLLLLILLVPVISLCESAEYYIRPTALTTSCPGQPCLTLNHFMNNTGYYIQSNTVLHFLPGKHILKRPLEIRNVNNVTLKSSTDGVGVYSQLHVNFPCENGHCYIQSAINLINVTNVVISDISLEIWTGNVSGVTVKQSTNIHLRLDIYNVQQTISYAIGVTANEASHLYMDRLRAGNLYLGIRVKNTNKVYITNSSLGDCQYSGLMMMKCDSVDISHTIFSGNRDIGMYLESCSNVSLKDISVMNNTFSGMYLESCSNITLTGISANDNQGNGMLLSSCTNTTLTSIYAINNERCGMILVFCSYTTLTSMHAKNNQLNGMNLESCSDLTLTNVHTTNNPGNGMVLISCNNPTLTNIYTTDNQQYGMDLDRSSNPTLASIYATGNRWSGVSLHSCSNATLTSIHAMNNRYGMHLDMCSNITATTIHASNNQVNGIYLTSCTNSTWTNIHTSNNQLDGMILMSCIDPTLTRIYTTDNQRNGIYLESCQSTIMTNIYARNNQWDGLYLEKCSNTTLTVINASSNQRSGIDLPLCTNISMANISANNQTRGMNLELSNDINITNVSTTNNHVNGINLDSCNNIRLENCVFSDIVSLSTLSIATELNTVPAIIELNNSTLIMSYCIFTGNNITSIKAIGSKIIPEGEIVFSDNRALLGAALLFASSSVLVIPETSSIIFHNNSADNYGGAIYILTDEFYTKSKSIQDLFQPTRYSLVTPGTRCFLSVEGNRSQARLIFSNNTAGKGGDILYGGLLALGYDGDWNCLLSFKNISDMSQQNGLSVISSEPSRVCLCHDGQPDCLTVADPVTRSVYPGQTITLPAVVVGQDFGTVTGSVIAQFLQTHSTCSIYLAQGQKSTYVNNRKCTDLKYTLYPSGGEKCTGILTLKMDNAEVLQHMNTDDNHKLNNSWAILNEEPNYHELASRILSETIACTLGHNFTDYYNEIHTHTTKNFLKFSSDTMCCINQTDKCQAASSVKFVFPKEIYQYPTFINISFQSCPLGFSLSKNKCDCNSLLQLMPQVTCYIQNQTISRDGLVWVGTYHGNETVAASKYCPYDYCKSVHTEITLSVQESDSEHGSYNTTDFQCNQHHSGVLCGGCQPGLSLALGTNRCLPCSNVYISLLLPFAVAGVLLVFFIKLLNLTISQGTMNELVFYVNVVSANKHLYYSQSSVNPMTLFIAWFNLDIGIETCFFNGLTAYSRTWLQFVFPLYIWAIAGLIIIIAKYSDRVAKVMGNNGVPVLATLFLLSYAKLFNTIITAMSYTTLYTTQGRKLVWSADGNLDYLGPKHIPLFCVAVATLVFLWFPYTLLLLLGQWLHRLNCRPVIRMLLNLKPFLDTHFAAFKDKHRYWFGLLLLVRAANLLISASIPKNTAGIVEFSTAILCILLTFWGQNVYRSNAVRHFGTTFLLNLSIMNVTKLFSNNSNSNITVASFTLIAIALAQFLALIIYKVAKHNHRLMACCIRKRNVNDDWELYEQAALEREMESDSDTDIESDESGSINSVPTY